MSLLCMQAQSRQIAQLQQQLEVYVLMYLRVYTCIYMEIDTFSKLSRMPHCCRGMSWYGWGVTMRL